jgi:hypothetical protein
LGSRGAAYRSGADAACSPVTPAWSPAMEDPYR